MQNIEFWKVTITTQVTWTGWFTSPPTLGELELALLSLDGEIWANTLELVRYAIIRADGLSAARVTPTAITIAGQQIGTFSCVSLTGFNNDKSQETENGTS